MVIEYLAGVGTGCLGLLVFFRWLWGRNVDAVIQRGPCAHCRRLLDMSELGPDHEHWRVCPKHPARAEVDRLQRETFERVTALRLALRQIADEADASEPISVKVSGWAQDALAIDDATVGHHNPRGLP